MAKLTVTQANAVNTLLDFILGDLTSEFGRPLPRPSADQARHAAEVLADDAYARLYAGHNRVSVRAGWPPDAVRVRARPRRRK